MKYDQTRAKNLLDDFINEKFYDGQKAEAEAKTVFLEIVKLIDYGDSYGKYLKTSLKNVRIITIPDDGIFIHFKDRSVKISFDSVNQKFLFYIHDIHDNLLPMNEKSLEVKFDGVNNCFKNVNLLTTLISTALEILEE